MTGKFEWLDNDVVQWVPDRFWPAHSTVALSVGGLPTDFKTGPVVLGVADISDHTFTVSIDGVQAESPPPLPAPHHRPHWGEEGVMPATMGQAGFPDACRLLPGDGERPLGDYGFEQRRHPRRRSRGVSAHGGLRRPYQQPRPLSCIQLRGRSIIGVENVSHGCISLSPVDAEWYFDKVHIGDPVIVQENGLEVPRAVSAEVRSR